LRRVSDGVRWPCFQHVSENAVSRSARAFVFPFNASAIFLGTGNILPGNDAVTSKGGICFGLLHFRDALSKASDDFLKKLETDKNLQTMALRRYGKLKGSAKK
jgi:hypothetical protein